MRKVFVVILCVLVGASYGAWRLQKGGDAGGRTRLVWVTTDDSTRREQVEMFNRENPDLWMTLDPGNFHMEKIIVQSLAGVGPDVFDVAGRYVLYGFVEAGITLDLTEIAAANGFGAGETWPAVAGALRINGRQYAFPSNVYGTVLFYNKAVFDRYGVPYPPRRWTWDEFVELGTHLTRKARAGGDGCFAAMGLHWYELVLQAGGRMYTADGTRCVLDGPESQEAFRFYYDLMYTHHLMPTPPQQASMSAEGGLTADFIGWFGAGRLAMVRLGSWGVRVLQRYEHLRDKIGVCHLPYKRRAVSLIGAKTCAINRGSANREGAVRFLRYLASETYNRQVVRSRDSLPPVPGYVDAGDAFSAIVSEAIEHGVVAEVSPLINPLVALRLVGSEIELMLAGVKGPQQACIDAAGAVNGRIYRNLIKYETFRMRYRAIANKEFDPDDVAWQAFRPPT